MVQAGTFVAAVLTALSMGAPLCGYSEIVSASQPQRACRDLPWLTPVVQGPGVRVPSSPGRPLIMRNAPLLELQVAVSLRLPRPARQA